MTDDTKKPEVTEEPVVEEEEEAAGPVVTEPDSEEVAAEVAPVAEAVAGDDAPEPEAVTVDDAPMVEAVAANDAPEPEAVAADDDTELEAVASDDDDAELESAAAVATPKKETKAKSSSRRAKAEPKSAPAPVKYAVIETGGKQYRVKVGDRITVERLADESGADVTIDRVLLLGGDGSTRIGTPVVDGATVTAKVEDHGRGEKIVVFKFKAKKRYRRRTGHRQAQTYLTITGISG